jgi:hypothetical protein
MVGDGRGTGMLTVRDGDGREFAHLHACFTGMSDFKGNNFENKNFLR